MTVTTNPRTPSRPYAPKRRQVLSSDGLTYVVYNFVESGRTYAEPIPPYPKSASPTLFALKRTGHFTTEHPFLGHAPSSDYLFSGLLESLNVDRVREDRWEARMPSKSDISMTSPANARVTWNCTSAREHADESRRQTTSKGPEPASAFEREEWDKARELPHLSVEEYEHFKDAVAVSAAKSNLRIEEEKKRRTGFLVPLPPSPPLPRIRRIRNVPLQDEAPERSAPSESQTVLLDVLPASTDRSTRASDSVVGNGVPPIMTAIAVISHKPYLLCEDEDKVSQWADLEDGLIFFIDAMKREKTFGGNPWFLDSRPFRTPSSFGYRYRGRSEESMRKARAAFSALIALARMYVESYRSYFHTISRVNNGKPVARHYFDCKWAREIHSRHPQLPMAWMDDILRTAVGRDSPGRVGVFVDIHDVYILGVVMYQIDLGMPVFIRCSLESHAWIAKLDTPDSFLVMSLLIREVEDPGFYRTLRSHLEHVEKGDKGHDERDVGEFPAWDVAGESGPEPIAEAEATIVYETQTTLPIRDPLVRFSARTPLLLMEKHEKALEALKAVEDDRARQSREAREANASTTRRCPGAGSKAAHCFEWDEDGDGAFVRRYVPRREVKDAWRRHSRFSRRYLSAWNEWDLWLGYDCAADGTYPAHRSDDELHEDWESDGTSGAEDEERPFILEAPDIEWNLADHAVYARQLEALDRRVAQARSRHEIGPKLGKSTLLERASKYLGYCLGIDRSKGERPTDEEMRLAVLKLFEVPEWQTKVPTQELMDICRLVREIGLADGNWRGLDPLLCDLHERSPMYVLNNRTCPVSILLHELSRASTSANTAHSKRLRIVTDTFYVFKAKGSPQLPFEIGVTEPIAALRALRFDGSFSDLIKDMLTSGVRVHFLRTKQDSKAHSPSIPRPLPLLLDDTLQPHDYRQYHSRLIRALADDPLLQFKALKEGGIVWRLVAQHVDVANILRNVADLASVPALDGTTISGMSSVFDDELTEEEERIICGVYDSTANLDGADDTLWSWWPRPLVWYKSSVYCGQWTMYHERWFLARQIALEKGNVEGELKIQSQWRSMLDGQRRRGDRFFKSSSKLAANFLREFNQV